METPSGQRWSRCLQLHHREERHQQRYVDHGDICHHQDHMQGMSERIVDQNPVGNHPELRMFIPVQNMFLDFGDVDMFFVFVFLSDPQAN